MPRTGGLGHNQPPAAKQTAPLFDDLVSRGEQIGRYGQPERLGGLEIDYQLKLCRKLHRQIARMLAAQDAVDVSGRAPLPGRRASSCSFIPELPAGRAEVLFLAAALMPPAGV
jgi:hypothetical protein